MKTKLLLLHGALGSKKQFESTRLLLDDKFEVYNLDFEGHGESISDKEFSIQLFTENVIEFLDKESIEKINVFGYSMGGYVALNTALKIPDRIIKIVTLGTKFNWDIESTEKEVRMLNPDKIEEKVPHFANKLKIEHHPQNWKEIVNKTARMMTELSKGLQLKEAELSLIKNEVLIGLGSLDKMVSLRESELASQIFPNGSLKMLMEIEHPIEKINPLDLAVYINESIE